MISQYVCCHGDYVEITTLGEVEQRYMCRNCGKPWIRHIAHRYYPPLRYAVLLDPDKPYHVQSYSSIYCGPPAPYPLVPTPEEILASATPSYMRIPG